MKGDDEIIFIYVFGTVYKENKERTTKIKWSNFVGSFSFWFLSFTLIKIQNITFTSFNNGLKTKKKNKCKKSEYNILNFQIKTWLWSTTKENKNEQYYEGIKKTNQKVVHNFFSFDLDGNNRRKKNYVKFTEGITIKCSIGRLRKVARCITNFLENYRKFKKSDNNKKKTNFLWKGTIWCILYKLNSDHQTKY